MTADLTRRILKDPTTQEAWVRRGAMVPEDFAPATCRREIEQRIGFYRDIARANKIVLD